MKVYRNNTEINRKNNLGRRFSMAGLIVLDCMGHDEADRVRSWMETVAAGVALGCCVLGASSMRVTR